MFEVVKDLFAVFGLGMAVLLIIPKSVFTRAMSEEVEEEEEVDEEVEYVGNDKAELERQAWRAMAKEKKLARELKQTRQARKNLEGQL